MIDVAIVTPAYDGRLHDDHARSVDSGRHMLRQNGISSVRLCLTGDAILPRVRNQCVAEALAQEAKQIVMVDSDIGFDAEMLLRLVAHEEAIVGAAPQAQLKNWRDAFAPRCVWRPFPGEMKTDKRGLVAVAGLATGFMKVRAEVFHKLAGQGFARRYVYPGTPPASWKYLAAYFELELAPLDLDNDPELLALCDEHDVPEQARMRWEGEDYSFCTKARVCGFPCWLDVNLRVRHWEGRSRHDFSVAEAMQGPPAGEDGA